MENDFVTYEQAVALQELGIYIQPPVYCCYQKTPILFILPTAMTTFDIIAPLKSQVFRLFREEYNILHALVVPIKITASDKEGYRYSWEIIDEQEEWVSDESLLGYYTYEEAENACIDKLIEIAKQQDNGK